jgi:hypothetical protein
MAAQKAQAGVLINHLHYALPGWDGAGGRRGAQGGPYESAQAQEPKGRAVWACSSCFTSKFVLRTHPCDCGPVGKL